MVQYDWKGFVMNEGPITPDEVGSHKQVVIPKFVFAAVNELIALNYCNGRAQVTQNDMIDKIIEQAAAQGKQISRNDIFDNKYLNIEEVYRDAGWRVKYDKPAYNESYDAYFQFEKK